MISLSDANQQVQPWSVQGNGFLVDGHLLSWETSLNAHVLNVSKIINAEFQAMQQQILDLQKFAVRQLLVHSKLLWASPIDVIDIIYDYIFWVDDGLQK